MQIDSNIKIIMLSVIVVSIIIGGIIMLKGLIYNKQVLDSDIYSFLPTQTSGILQINKEKSLDNALPYFGDLSKVIVEIKPALNYPFIEVQYEKQNYIVTKVTGAQEKYIKKLLLENIFPNNTPHCKMYKNIKLYFYLTPENTYFICSFIDGIFICGFDTALFEMYIHNKKENKLGIINSSLKNIVDNIKKQYEANLILNNHSFFSIFNISFEENRTEMVGYTTQTEVDNRMCNNDTSVLKIDYSIFPNSLIAYKVEKHQSRIIHDSLKCQFYSPLYSFYLKPKMKAVHALRCKNDKYDIYNKLNILEESYINKKFEINDFHLGLRIYTTSQQMGKSVFGFENQAFLVFYENYVIFSDNKNAVTYYLNQITSSDLKNKLRNDILEDDIIYSRNLKIWHPDFFNPNNPITEFGKKNIYATSRIKNRKKIYDIYINN